jgi:hypothetical protein
MKGFPLFRRQIKNVTTVSIMLLPDQILLAISGQPPRFITKAIPLGESWSQVLAELFREQKLQHSQVRVVLDSSQYQQLSIERPDLPEEELAGALPWAIKDFTSEPVTQLAIDYYDAAANPSARPRLQVICTPKQRIKEWVKALQPMATLESVSIDELALAALFGRESKVDVLLYQLPGHEPQLLAVYQGRLCFSRALRGFLPLVQQSADQWPDDLLDHLMLEMQRSFDYLLSQLKLPEVATIHVAAGIDDPAALLRPLHQHFGIPAKWLANPSVLVGLEFLPVYGALLEQTSA